MVGPSRTTRFVNVCRLNASPTDGAYDEGIADVRFLPAATPTVERMHAVLAQVHEAIAPAAEVGDLDLDPALAACVQLALAGPHLAPPPEPATRPPLTVSAFGMQLHAATTVDGRDRKQLERLCRYMLRPPFAHDAVQALEGGRVRVHFKAPWRSGAAHADMSPDKFHARLCGLVPPPGFHMTRYFGVFANRHHLRARVIPPAVVPAPEQQLTLRLVDADAADDDDDDACPARGRAPAAAAILIVVVRSDRAPRTSRSAPPLTVLRLTVLADKRHIQACATGPHARALARCSTPYLANGRDTPSRPLATPRPLRPVRSPRGSHQHHAPSSRRR